MINYVKQLERLYEYGVINTNGKIIPKDTYNVPAYTDNESQFDWVGSTTFSHIYKDMIKYANDNSYKVSTKESNCKAKYELVGVFTLDDMFTLLLNYENEGYSTQEDMLKEYIDLNRSLWKDFKDYSRIKEFINKLDNTGNIEIYRVESNNEEILDSIQSVLSDDLVDCVCTNNGNDTISILNKDTNGILVYE